MMTSASLFLGRFQPFHRGHYDAFLQIKEQFPHDPILIGIGSATENFQKENPFTARERAIMIDSSLSHAGFSREEFSLLPIPNIQHFSLYPAYLESLLPPFSRVFSGSLLLRRIFLEQSTLPIFPFVPRIALSATMVRAAMINGGEEWKNLVSPPVAHFLEEIQAPQRLSQICFSNFSS